MKARLLTIWERLHTSFWFVPGLVIAGAFVLSIFTLRADEQMNQAAVNRLPFVFHDGVEGARGLLSTVAGSMITVTGVTFSVVIVAFTLASSQFTPRLLRNFMRDVGNQVVLAIFIATFTYCLCILRVVGGPAGDFIPRVSVTCGFALAAISIGALVYFIHHASLLIQAPTIVATIARELDNALEPLCTAGAATAAAGGAELPADYVEQSAEVHAAQSDYIEAIDTQGLFALAEANEITIAVERRPGDFIGVGEVIAHAFPAARVSSHLCRTICGAFLFGPERTQTQDPEFVLNELVEIAVRALSPGINDPATAVLCVDRLGAALIKVAALPITSARRYSPGGELRLVAKHYGFRGLADAAFNQIRQYSRDSVPVTMRLLEALQRIAPHVQRDEDLETLLRHAAMIERGSRREAFDEVDRAGIEERYHAVLAALRRTGSV
ncbi:MAG: DUF2254 domain-containing protein [Verrucomicrobiota bacterium]|nr:DUF2254 domain-containing protein [Verrucomicrobiota bacterium]